MSPELPLAARVDGAFEQHAKDIEALRGEILFGDSIAEQGDLSPESEQHLLLALAALESAHRHMALAGILAKAGR